MPSGYTERIKDGMSFRTFALLCSRAFGPLIHMHDEPLEKKIALPRPSAYYRRKLAKHVRQLQHMERVPLGRAIRNAKRDARHEYESELREYKKSVAEESKLRNRYEAMLAHVKAWKPPSKEHRPLRTFMIEQLKRSIGLDCGEPSDIKEPVEHDWWEFLGNTHERLSEEAMYHRKKNAEEIARVSGNRRWIGQLFKSLPPAKK